MWQAPYIRKFLNRHRNDGSGGLRGGIDEPTYVSFWVDFVTTSENTITAGDFNQMPHGLLTPPDAGSYSTEEYLRNIGYPLRANNIKAFRELITKITKEAPWTITSISGIDTLYKTDPSEGFMKRGGKDKTITISMTDAIDMRANALMDLYKLAAVDEEYSRDLLPDIMKYFKMRIWVSEFRLFHEPKVKNTFGDPGNIERNVYNSTTSKLTPTSFIETNAPSSIIPNTRVARDINSLYNFSIGGGQETDGFNTDGYFLQRLQTDLSLFRFDLSQCEIDIASIKPSWAEELTNTNIGELVTLSFDIKVGNVDYMGSYPIIYSLLDTALTDFNFNSALINNTYSSNLEGGGSGTGNRKTNRSGKTIDSYFDVLSASRGYTNENMDFVYSQKEADGHLADVKTRSENVQDTLDRLGENLVRGAGEMIIGAADDFLVTQANKALLGNVYGFAPQQLINRISSNPASIALATQDLLGRVIDPITGQAILNNVYGQSEEASVNLEPKGGKLEVGGSIAGGMELGSVKDTDFQGTATDDSNRPSTGILGPNS